MDFGTLRDRAMSLTRRNSRRHALRCMAGGTISLAAGMVKLGQDAEAATCQDAGEYCRGDAPCCFGAICVGFDASAICLGGGDCVMAVIEQIIDSIPVWAQIQLGIDLFGHVKDLVTAGRYEEAFNEVVRIAAEYKLDVPFDCFPVRQVE